tara:strand:+ start:126 stop:548 length:423 start_codon:yes stop_codon:yes gene_type:complete
MKLSVLKNIIKEEITKLQEQMNTNPNQYTIVPSLFFGQHQDLMSQQPGGQGFDGLSWAQNFQTTKLTQVDNPCNFLKNQITQLADKQDKIFKDEMRNVLQSTGSPAITQQQVRSRNKHYDRMYIKMKMMVMMRQQNSCPA